MFAQQLVNGLVVGAVYALIDLGCTLVYGILQLINFAHGEIYMIGAYVGVAVLHERRGSSWAMRPASCATRPPFARRISANREVPPLALVGVLKNPSCVVKNNWNE